MKDGHWKHIQGTLYTLLFTIPLNLKGLILIPILTKNLSVNAYGTLSIAQTLYALCIGVLALGLGGSITRFYPIEKGTPEGSRMISSLFWLTFCLNSLFLLFCVFFSKFVSQVTHLPQEIIPLIGLITLEENLFGIFIEYFRASERFAAYSFITAAKAYVELCIISLFVWKFHDTQRVLLAIFINGSIFALGTGLYLALKIRLFSLKLISVKKFLKFSLPSIPAFLSDWVINLSDRYLIGMFLGATAVGVYSPSYALAGIILFVPTTFQTMLPPILARLHDLGEESVYEDLLIYSMKYSLLLGIPFCAGSFVLAKPLLLKLSNPTIADTAWFITPMIAAANVLLGSARFFTLIANAKKKTELIAKAWTVAALLNVILNVLFLKKFGILAAALSTLASFGWIFFKLKHDLRAYIPRLIGGDYLLKISIASASMATLVWTAQNLLGLNIFVTIPLGVVCYMAFVFFVQTFDDREKKLILALRKKFRLI